jgi:glyoxylase-like metal-dependent hydrolase (beta-lactamase superfamily II)
VSVVKHSLSRRALLGAGVGMAASMTLPGKVFSAGSGPVAATKLNDRLLLISGLGGNLVALRDEAGLLLVDSGASGSTDQLLAELSKFARGAKVHTVLNTHRHAEQTGGNDVFGAAGAKIIAHAKAAQRMAVDQYVPWEDRYIKARNKVAVPKEVFYYGSRQMQSGKERIEYGYLQQPHTDGDIYVYLRESNVLLVGDAVSPRLDPLLAWFEGGWLGGRVDSQSKLLAIGNEQTRIIAATGEVISRAELKTERDAMATAFERVSDAIRKGMTTEAMQKARLLDGLPRTWANPDKFLYDAHKGMWAHYNKLSHSIV